MKYSILAVSLIILLGSCSDNEPGTEQSADRWLEGIFVEPMQRTFTDDPDASVNNDYILITDFQEDDKLYFSQLSSNLDPNFGTDASQFPYQYVYSYVPMTGATWYDGYNFKAISQERELDWDVVKTVGSVGNSFSMYAMFFPIENEIRFNVETDQRGGTTPETMYDTSNFMKSDIMGAYHATSSLYTRLRFRLFHLMVYLKVTLYVPVYEDNGVNTDASFSGFLPGSMLGSYVLDAIKDFSIEWRANRSSDTEAPLTQVNAQSAKSNIRMYAHEPDENNIFPLQVSDYVTSDVYKTIEGLNQDGSDDVRAYDFSVLFPAQSFDENFLCFVLQAPDQQQKYYYFSGSQIVGESGNYTLTQGTLLHLSLYLPRKTNQTILIGANILPWQNAVTDMTVTKKETQRN